MGYIISFVVGVVLGAAVIFGFLYVPSQRLLGQRERAVTDMLQFVREEQQRVRDLSNISTSEMLKYIALVEQTNTAFHQIQQRLHEQERALANPGRFYIVLMAFVIGGAAIFYILIARTAYIKDSTTLENFDRLFQTYIAKIGPQADDGPLLENNTDAE